MNVNHKGIGRVYCPFHDDTNPSAALLPGINGGWVFTCRACGGRGLPLGKLYASVLRIPLASPAIAKAWHRLRSEVGTLVLPELDVPIPTRPGVLKRFCEGFLLLHQINLATARPGDALGTVFTKSFAPPWCGISESSFHRTRGTLLQDRWLQKTGSVTAANGRAMSLYAPVTSGDRP